MREVTTDGLTANLKSLVVLSVVAVVLAASSLAVSLRTSSEVSQLRAAAAPR